MSIPIDTQVKVSVNNSCNDMNCCCFPWPNKHHHKKTPEQIKKDEVIKTVANRCMETYD